jgi:competence protein ComGC
MEHKQIKDEDKDKITWQTFKNNISNNLTFIKVGLIIISVLFLYYVYNSQKTYKNIQSGGAPKLGIGKAMQSSVKGLGMGINKTKSGLGRVTRASPLTSGFSILFQFVNGFMMIFGIIIILILIPTIPILIFFAISYFICRRKIWELRTL